LFGNTKEAGEESQKAEEGQISVSSEEFELKDKHSIEPFSSVRLFDSNGLKRLGFSPWMVGYSQKLSLCRSAFCPGAKKHQTASIFCFFKARLIRWRVLYAWCSGIRTRGYNAHISTPK